MKIKIEAIQDGITGAFLKDIKKAVLFPYTYEVEKERFDELANDERINASALVQPESKSVKTKKIK